MPKKSVRQQATVIVRERGRGLSFGQHEAESGGVWCSQCYKASCIVSFRIIMATHTATPNSMRVCLHSPSLFLSISPSVCLGQCILFIVCLLMGIFDGSFGTHFALPHCLRSLLPFALSSPASLTQQAAAAAAAVAALTVGVSVLL